MRKFLPGEKNKSVIEKELAAIHWALNYFKPYLYGVKFLVRTDHRPLVYLFGMTNPSSKLTHMRLDLEEFDFEIEYVRGKDNVCADALSRLDFEDIKNLRDNNQLTAVTTRSMTNKKKNVQETNPNDEKSEIVPSKIYEVLSKYEYMVRLNLLLRIVERNILIVH